MKIRYLILILVAAFLLIVLYLVGRPVQPLERAVVNAPSAKTVTPVQGRAVETHSISYRLSQGTAHEPDIHQLPQGSRVVISVTTDQPDELHLHGYEFRQRLKAGEPATIEFVAEHAGRFELELHRSHQVLGVIEIMPR